ncbi:hypothetical protein JW926_11845 [Candidatus Sumerlaeota bacterium]|nr:hypothetical protein [Candidatus Sumerlaeota bacterium]
MFKRICLGCALFFLFWGICFAKEPPTQLPDLTVSFIHRDLSTPSWRGYVKIEEGIPVLSPDAPQIKERWPSPIKQVGFTASILNRGHASSPKAAGFWTLDGVEKKMISIPPLNPDEKFSSDFLWEWRGGAHELSLELNFETTGALEISTQNNILTIRTDALPFCFYVNQLVEQTFRKTENLMGSYNFSDWLQAHIAQFNIGLRMSQYPGAPKGCLEQIYADRIVSYASLADLEALRKEYDASAQGVLIFEPHAQLMNWAKNWDSFLLMEFLFQMGMPDLRNLDVDPQKNTVPDQNGYPLYWRYVHEPFIFRVPGGEFRFSEFTILAMNKMYGRPRGFTGDFLYDMPEEYVLFLADRGGRPVDNARVRIFQRNLEGEIDPNPILDDHTDSKGFLKLPNKPAPEVSTPMGFSQRPNPFGNIDVYARNGLFFIEVRARDHLEYFWRSIAQFNTTFWKEMMDSRWRDYPVYSLPMKIQTNIPVEGASPAPVHFRGNLVGESLVSFQWLPPIQGEIARYRLYGMPHGPDISTGRISLLGEVNAPAASIENIAFPVHDMYYAVTAVDARERESAFTSWLYLPFCPRMKSLAYSNEENIYVYDEETNRVLRQDDKGFFLPFFLFNPDETGAMPRVSSLAWTPLNELAVCVGKRDRIDFYKPEGNLLRSIGKSGRNPGELRNPSDIAFNKKREMAVADRDNKRIQIFDLQGKYLGRLGEVHLDDPIALAFSPEGHLHVLDAAQKTCMVFHEKAPHKFYYEYSYGSFKNPVDILINGKGSVHVSDQDVQGIMIFSSNGRLMSTEQLPHAAYFGYSHPQDMTLDSKGRVIYVDSASSSIRNLEEGAKE